MVDFKRFSLHNGLKILVNEDFSTPLVAMNILYNVGSRDEDPDQTGLAHLFEHLMFSGSGNIPDFDSPLQLAGGENNAYTSNDVTVYYLTLPAENLETGLWLESDRMLGLDFSPEKMEIQKKVVAEEFKQRYLNQPYGDVMHILRDQAYKKHPYKWPTIGKELSHIEKVNLNQVKSFFYTHYAPNNAIISFSGNVRAAEAFDLTEKWFGDIPKREIPSRKLPAEPEQNSERKVTVEKNVPADLIYKAWHVCSRSQPDFHVLDLLTDIMAGGESGRLHASLVRDKKLFSEINAYLTGDIDPGLLLIYGKLMDDTDIHKAEEEIMIMVESLKKELPPAEEMEKVKNKFEAATVLTNSTIISKASGLSFYELLGDAGIINTEVDSYRNVNCGSVRDAANKYFLSSNCSTLYYKSVK